MERNGEELHSRCAGDSQPADGSKSMKKAEKEERRKTITQADIEERMRDCWEKLKFGRNLTKLEAKMVDYNFNLISLYIELKGNSSDEHTFACGFHYDEDVEDYDEDDEDDDNECVGQ